MSTMRRNNEQTLRAGDRVRKRYGADTETVGRVVQTTHCAAVVLWAPTLARLQAQERMLPNVYRAASDSFRDGTYSFRDLELC